MTAPPAERRGAEGRPDLAPEGSIARRPDRATGRPERAIRRVLAERPVPSDARLRRTDRQRDRARTGRARPGRARWRHGTRRYPGPPNSNGSTTSAPADRKLPRTVRPCFVWCCLVLLVGAWLAIGAVGGPAIGSLSSVQSNDQKTFLPPDAESVKASEAAAAFTPVQALPAFVVFATSGRPGQP